MWYALLLQALVLTQTDCTEPLPLVLGKQSTVAISDHLMRLPDPDARLTFEDVTGAEACHRAVPQAQSRPPLLMPSEPTWYRFRLTTVASRSSDWLLRVPAQGLPEVCVYWPLRQGYDKRCEGRGRDRLHGAHYLFDLPPALNVQKPVVIHVQGGLVSPHPMALVTRTEHARSERAKLMSTGIFLGLMIAVIVLCWVAFVYQGERTYLYFSGFVLFCGLSVAGFLGRGLTHLGIESAWFATSGPPTFAAAGLVFLVLFCRSRLELKADPRSIWNAVCLAAIAANVLIVLLAAGKPSVAMRLLPVACFVNLGLLLVLCGLYAVNGSRRARYLLAALAVFAAGTLSASAGALLNHPGLLAAASPTVTAGAIIMPLILVLDLYRQYRTMARERDNARGALMAEQRLALLRSSYCRLTGLPRRGRVNELFARMTHASSPENIRIGVYLLHIDKLSEIRRRHGRETLEMVVNILASRMREGLDEDQLLGRLDNWELVIIVPTGVRDDDFRSRLYAAAERIAGCIQEPMDVAGQSMQMSVSVGLSIWPLHGYSFDDLLKRCDSALYEAQAAGGNRFKVFTEADHDARTDQFRKLNDLRRALDEDQLELHYQPVHLSGNGDLAGMEALIRWRHPELGMIYPDEFIPLAEESDLILDIGYWVLDQVVEDLSWLNQQGFGDIPVALNVSPRQFSHPGFASHINYYLKNRDIDPARLHLEITEDSLIDNMEQTREALELLRTVGVKVYVDDFGVGYSSLNYIRSLPIHGLKIDKSFVMNIGRTTQDEAVVGTIVRLARNLHLNIVAEGVENEYQRKFLHSLGCGTLQGHLFSQPIPKEALIDYLAANRAVAAG